VDINTITLIIGALLAVSEALSLIPVVKANGVFQVLWRLLKLVAGEKKEE